MNKAFETKISDLAWWIMDIPGNLGWILYLITLYQILKEGMDLYAFLLAIPAVLMIIGVIELISERIAKMDRVLPKKRLYRGFGVLTLGGLLGTVLSIYGLFVRGVTIRLLIGSILCMIFAGAIFFSFREKKDVLG